MLRASQFVLRLAWAVAASRPSMNARSTVLTGYAAHHWNGKFAGLASWGWGNWRPLGLDGDGGVVLAFFGFSGDGCSDASAGDDQNEGCCQGKNGKADGVNRWISRY